MSIQQHPSEFGPAQLKGDDAMDITVPPTPPSRSARERWPEPRNENTFEARRDAAWFHTAATSALVGMLLVWASAHGQVPAEDATAGITNLILHFGAWITGFLAIDAAIDARRLRREDLAQFPNAVTAISDLQATAVVFLGCVTAFALLANTAMVLAAFL